MLVKLFQFKDNDEEKFFLKTLSPSNCHDELNWVSTGIMTREEVNSLKRQINKI